jgi:hypothetical protein
MTDAQNDTNNKEREEESVKRKEKELHDNFINAQYEYFKFIEPIKIKEIQDRNKGKVINPYHWRSRLRMEIDEKKHVSCKKDTSNYKKLLLATHPDKNPQRIDEATKYFQFIQSLIDDERTDCMDDIMNAQNIWDILKEMTEDNSMYMKKKYCDKIRNTQWFTWTTKDDEQYVTEEELRVLMIAECKRLREENERLCEYNEMVQKYNECMRKQKDDDDSETETETETDT